jgi:hypothetical protein
VSSGTGLEMHCAGSFARVVENHAGLACEYLASLQVMELAQTMPAYDGFTGRWPCTRAAGSRLLEVLESLPEDGAVAGSEGISALMRLQWESHVRVRSGGPLIETCPFSRRLPKGVVNRFREGYGLGGLFSWVSGGESVP